MVYISQMNKLIQKIIFLISTNFWRITKSIRDNTSRLVIFRNSSSIIRMNFIILVISHKGSHFKIAIFYQD